MNSMNNSLYRSKGHKKKLNSFIQFPETLDMSEFLGLVPGTKVYNVSAVLVHMGSSAYSGHYVGKKSCFYNLYTKTENIAQRQ